MFHFLSGSWEAASPCSSLCHHGLDRQKHLYWVPRQTDLRKIHRAFMCPSGVQGQQILFHGTDIVQHLRLRLGDLEDGDAIVHVM